MRTELRTLCIAAVAAVALALSGSAWAQQSKNAAGSSSTTKAAPAATKSSSAKLAGDEHCVKVKNGGCIHSKGGSDIEFKVSAPRSTK